MKYCLEEYIYPPPPRQVLFINFTFSICYFPHSALPLVPRRRAFARAPAPPSCPVAAPRAPSPCAQPVANGAVSLLDPVAVGRDGRSPPPVGAPHPPGSRRRAIARGGSPPRCAAWHPAHAESFACCGLPAGAPRPAAGPRTRRDGRPPGLPARAAIYPRRIMRAARWGHRALPPVPRCRAPSPGLPARRALKLDFAHYSVPHLALFSTLSRSRKFGDTPVRKKRLTKELPLVHAWLRLKNF